MKKKLIFILIVCATVCMSTSCARKVNGATPHRRDRNCGCENLSPTPNNVQCTMNNVQFEVTDMEMYDVYGKVVRIVETLRATSLQEINVHDLAPGLYFIRLTTNQCVVTKPFVKK